jgi:hypothetical protein
MNRRGHAETHEMMSKLRKRTILQDDLRGETEFWRKGIRHIGGATLVQARLRNVGTCRCDDKGEFQAKAELSKKESTNAQHGDGGYRSSDEAV